MLAADKTMSRRRVPCSNRRRSRALQTRLAPSVTNSQVSFRVCPPRQSFDHFSEVRL